MQVHITTKESTEGLLKKTKVFIIECRIEILPEETRSVSHLRFQPLRSRFALKHLSDVYEEGVLLQHPQRTN